MKTFEERMKLVTKITGTRISTSSEYLGIETTQYIQREPALQIAKDADCLIQALTVRLEELERKNSIIPGVNN